MILPIALLALCSLPQAATVSFTCRAEPLSHLVVDLSKLTGMKLTVTKECANDVLLISVKGVALDMLLAEIAKVDAGGWEKNGDTLRFAANSAARHAEARAELAKHAKVVKAVLQKEEANLLKRESQPDQNGSGARVQSLQGLSEAEVATVYSVINGFAAEEAVLNLLENTDPELLVLQRQQRVVLSTHPTGMQLQLGSGADAAIGTMVDKRNAVAKLLQSSVAVNVQKSGAGDQGGPPGLPNVKPVPAYSKADLSVMDAGATGNLEVQLLLYTAEGAVALRSRTFDISSEQADEALLPTQTKIEISDAAKAFRTMFESQEVGNSAIVAVPPAIVPYFMDAEHNDPLALSSSDEILALARSQGKPLVAVVPDSAFADTQPLSLPTTLEGFSQSLAAGDTMTSTTAGDWIEIKPSNPETSRQYRCDRAALGRLMRACMQESIPTLEEFADFVAGEDLANNDVVGAYLSTAIAGYGNGGLGTENVWNLYRVFGEFTADQRASLISGAKLPLSVLTVSQVADFSQFAYGAMQRLRYGIAPPPLAANFPSARRIDNDAPQFPQRAGLPSPKGFESESTELLPNGLQANGYIEMQVVEEPFVSPFGPTTTQLVVPRVMGVAQVANRQVASTQPEFAKTGAIKFERFKLGTRKLHVLTIHGSDRAFVSGRLYDFRLYKDSPDFAMSDMSADWQSELTKRVTAYKQNLAAAAAADRRTPPPPPLR